jgi:hypothetical protein
VVIQVNPQTESVQPSAAEAIHRQGPAKKEGLGVFAKILAGLLRKAGEKDGQSLSAADSAEKLKSGAKDGEITPDEIAALFPGQGAVRGKKPAGTLEMGIHGADQNQHNGKLLAGDSAGGDGLLDGASGGDLLRHLPWEAPGGEPEVGGRAKGSSQPGLSPEGGEGGPAGESDGFRSLDNLDFGDFLGARPEAGEDGSAGRKGKTGDKPVYVDAPEENSSARSREAAAGLFPGGLRPENSGEKGRDDPRSRLAEARQKDKRRDKITLEVQDSRTGEDRNSGALAAQNTRGLEPRPLAGRGEVEILVELRGGSPGREPSQAAAHTWESRAGQSFENFLARELHQNLNGDIVRHASVALRDGGEGTIRLALRPESLGNVKIRLEMADNKVTGHIVVESEAALRAFEREAASLEQAFRDSGFDGADLDMSLARGGGGMEGWAGEEAGRPAMPERLAARSYDAAQDGLEGPGATAEVPAGIFTRNGRLAVNMLV